MASYGIYGTIGAGDSATMTRDIVCAYGIYGIYGGTKPAARAQIDEEPLDLWHRLLSEPRTTNNS
jgi:hypothetical protein